MQISVSTVVGVLVALRKESVDRNDVLAVSALLELMSLSARRAWIEIAYGALDGASEITVALRKESVDRNPSNSSKCSTFARVALRKESVDRNC